MGLMIYRKLVSLLDSKLKGDKQVSSRLLQCPYHVSQYLGERLNKYLLNERINGLSGSWPFFNSVTFIFHKSPFWLLSSLLSCLFFLKNNSLNIKFKTVVTTGPAYCNRITKRKIPGLTTRKHKSDKLCESQFSYL